MVFETNGEERGGKTGRKEGTWEKGGRYQPTPKPGPVRGILFQQRFAIEVCIVDNVQSVELAAELGPVEVAPCVEVCQSGRHGLILIADACREI